MLVFSRRVLLSLLLVLLCLISCVSPDSLLVQQHKACQREMGNNMGGAPIADVYEMSSGQIGVPSRSERVSRAGATVMSACMGFWDEELSIENAKSESSVE